MAFLRTQVVDNNGFTPLICACYESHSACVKLLLEKVGALFPLSLVRLVRPSAPDARHPSPLVCVGGHGC